MSRRSALFVCVLLAVASAAGANAVLSTSALRAGAPKPEVASARSLARRARQLDAWQASLVKAARARPPALLRVPRYARIPTTGAAALGRLPVVSPPRRSAGASTRNRTVRISASAVPAVSAAPGRLPGKALDDEGPAPTVPAPATVPTAPAATVPVETAPTPAPAAESPAPPAATTTTTWHHDGGDDHQGTGTTGGGGDD